MLLITFLTQLAARLSGPLSSPISIRGASKQSSLASRLPRRVDPSRRGPVSPGQTSISARSVDVWREFVQKRWNPDAQFLNLEVRSLYRFRIFPHVPLSTLPPTRR